MSDEKTEILIGNLGSGDAMVRKRTREQLVERGGLEVTRALVGELVDPRQHVRWEAAKALAAIADPVAAPALMDALEDRDEDVRWVAGEGLIALGTVGLTTVLSGLTKRAESLNYCQAAHHVLHDLKSHVHTEVIIPVLQSLETPEPAVTAPAAALSALMALKTGA